MITQITYSSLCGRMVSVTDPGRMLTPRPACRPLAQTVKAELSPDPEWDAAAASGWETVTAAGFPVPLYIIKKLSRIGKSNGFHTLSYGLQSGPWDRGWIQ